jgi:hypothetical protein
MSREVRHETQRLISLFVEPGVTCSRGDFRDSDLTAIAALLAIACALITGILAVVML